MNESVSPTVKEFSFEDIKENIPIRKENSHKGRSWQAFDNCREMRVLEEQELCLQSLD